MNTSLDLWISAMEPGDWTVHGGDLKQGVKLKELTFGHMVLMERMLCLTSSQIDGIAHCVLICSRGYKEARDYIHWWKFNDRYAQELRDLIEKIIKNPVIWYATWIDYFKAHTTPMQSMKKQRADGNPAKNLGAPFLARLRVILTSSLGYDPLTLNDAPFSACLMDIQTNAELNGQVNIAGGSAVSDAINKLIKHVEKKAKK